MWPFKSKKDVSQGSATDPGLVGRFAYGEMPVVSVHTIENGYVVLTALQGQRARAIYAATAKDVGEHIISEFARAKLEVEGSGAKDAEYQQAKEDALRGTVQGHQYELPLGSPGAAGIGAKPTGIWVKNPLTTSPLIARSRS